MSYDPVPPFRRNFDAARDPYTARNALGITSTGGSGGGFITAVTPPLQVTGTTLSIDLSAYLTTAAAAATYQPLDGDLTAIAALSGTNVIYYRSAANTWAAVTIGTGLSFSGGTLTATGGGGGNVSNSGTPTSGQYAKWVTATTIQGVAPATVLSDIGAAPLASPTFTGDPKAPTPATADNDTSIATTAYVQAQGYLTAATATASYQPLDADLTSLAAASATNSLYYRSAANTWATVTIGTGLSFSGGTLSSTVTSGISDAPSDGSYYSRRNATWTALGTMAIQNASAVAITGGTIDGCIINGGTF